eukprot:scaffold3296_cov405-Prasinococcus_capsulatus_cf.AAC.8
MTADSCGHSAEPAPRQLRTRIVWRRVLLTNHRASGGRAAALPNSQHPIWSCADGRNRQTGAAARRSGHLAALLIVPPARQPTCCVPAAFRLHWMLCQGCARSHQSSCAGPPLALPECTTGSATRGSWTGLLTSVGLQVQTVPCRCLHCAMQHEGTCRDKHARSRRQCSSPAQTPKNPGTSSIGRYCESTASVLPGRELLRCRVPCAPP